MKYDFDTVIDRRHRGDLKWDVAADELPMWVADMDFAAAPEIIAAVQAVVDRGVFGYTTTTPAFGEALVTWWWRRHGWRIDPGWITFAIGVVPALSSLIRTLTPEGGNVAIQAPTYNHFFSSIRNSGRVAVSNDLTYRGGKYQLNWGDLEATLADPATHLFILCNPQNPTGNVWSADQLERMGALARKYNVVVIADEIHCDLTNPGVTYTPFASVNAANANCAVTVVSPTKAFNIPGLQTAAVITANADLRERVTAGLNRDEMSEPNAFSAEAAIAAFTQGGPWLDQARAYIHRNKTRLTEYIARELPQLRVVPSQATYLMWIDCAVLADDTTAFCTFLREETGLYIMPGILYGEHAGRFVRVNVACPATVLEDGLARLKAGVAAWKARG